MGWILERPTGTVAERHGPIGLIAARSVLVHEIDRPTLVLGSAGAAKVWGGGGAGSSR